MTRSRESGVRGGEGGLRGYNNDVKVGGWVDSGWWVGTDDYRGSLTQTQA